MSLRISSLLAAGALVLASCGAEAEALPGEVVECALGLGAQLTPDCTLEREEAVGQAEIRVVIHHPGGGFRRIRLNAETLGVTPADGAERVTAQMVNEEALAFTIGGDAYRIPLSLLNDEP
ncbi:MAG: hypothetical protein ACXIUO_04685 [Erythrobacter sp.]